MVSAIQLFEILLNGLTIGMVYVLVAAGLSIVFGVMDVLNISHGELLALGAYFAFSFTVGLGEGGFWLALILVPLIVGVIGVVIERTMIRRVYGRGHLSQILLTFGLLLIIYDAKEIIWGTRPKLFTPPEVINHAVNIFGFSYSLYNYFMIVSAGLLALLTWALLNYTRFGIVVRAGSEDRGMVRNLGINIDRYYTLVFGFGAAIAAFGGVVLGGYQNVNLEMGNAVIIPAFVIVVLGGLGSFRGAVVGGLLVGTVQSFVITFVPAFQGTIIFLLMIGVLLVRPQGLFGSNVEQVSAGNSEPSEFVSGLGGGVLGDQTRSRLGIAAVGLLLLVPLFQGILYTEFVVTLLITVLIWALFAMSIDVILGHAGLISLGQAMFYGLGAYAVVLTLMHASPSALVAVLVAMVASAVIAWVVGYLAIRVSGVYFVMITLAFAEVFHQIVTNLNFTGGDNGLFGGPEPLYGLGGVGIRFDDIEVVFGPIQFGGDTVFYYFLLAVVIASFLIVRRIMSAPFGSVLQSVRESELRARFIGYDVQSFKRQSFVLSGILAGLAGAMFGLYNGYAAPAMLHWIVSGDVIVMAVLGGSGTLYGPMIGAGTFTLLEEWLSSMIHWWRLLLGVIFVAVVLFLPQGIISIPTRIAEFVDGRTDTVSITEEGNREVDD